jgi:hypothetical protein
VLARLAGCALVLASGDTSGVRIYVHHCPYIITPLVSSLVFLFFEENGLFIGGVYI